MSNLMEAGFDHGTEIVPGYRLLQPPLGRGGFGEVYKAIGPGDIPLAIKIITLDRNKQGLKEFRALSLVRKIHQPNLVPIIAIWIKDEEGNVLDHAAVSDSVNLKARAAELIIGMGLGDKNLLDRLHECQAAGDTGIPLMDLLNYMRQASRAIDFLNQPKHDLGNGLVAIQHCDIKPQNILIVGGGVQVCDFGLARVLGEQHRATSMNVAASLAYSAPEFLNERIPSATSDQYSLAISYIELRTGQLPFDAKAPVNAIMAHVKGQLDLSKLQPKEQQVVAKALNLNPAKRFPTCTDFVNNLRRAHAITTFGPITQMPAKLKPEQTNTGNGAKDDGSGSGSGSPSSGFSKAMAGEGGIRVGTEIVPGYKATRKLGQGGFGQVWEAIAPGGRRVAVKIIENLENTSGQQEFRAMELVRRVEHNHLLELHAFWLLNKEGKILDKPELLNTSPETTPQTLIIASRLANQNLMDRLKECQKAGHSAIPHDELLRYLWQTSKAIDYLNAPKHKLGGTLVSIQHRDIKPQNILLAGGVVKVADFGLAKVVEGSSAVIHQRSVAFTPHYTAPETFLNEVTAWSDQYSLALTYYHLRTGTLPFPKKASPLDLMLIHRDGRLDLSGVPDAERAVLAKATKVKPIERFPDCVAMARALVSACNLPDTDLSWNAVAPETVGAGVANGETEKRVPARERQPQSPVLKPLPGPHTPRPGLQPVARAQQEPERPQTRQPAAQSSPPRLPPVSTQPPARTSPHQPSAPNPQPAPVAEVSRAVTEVQSRPNQSVQTWRQPITRKPVDQNWSVATVLLLIAFVGLSAAMVGAGAVCAILWLTR